MSYPGATGIKDAVKPRLNAKRACLSPRGRRPDPRPTAALNAARSRPDRAPYGPRPVTGQSRQLSLVTG